MPPLKDLSTFLRTLEMPLINCEINLDINWSENCVIVATNVAAETGTFSITDTKLYVPVATLSTQENAKLLKQLKSGFKRTVNWNKYFQGVSRLFFYLLKKKHNEPVSNDVIFRLEKQKVIMFWLMDKTFLINQ